MNLVDKIKEIRTFVATYTSADMYLFGSSLRYLLTTGNFPDIVDIIVSDFNPDTKRKLSYPNVNFIFSDNVDYSHEYYTMDNIYVKIPINFDGNLEILSTNNGLVDLNKKIIKLSRTGKKKVEEDPNFILDTITLVAENKFNLDSITISAILKNKHLIKDAEPKNIFSFFKNIVSYKHPRKIVSLTNTLGLSKELFGVNLLETSIVNHLKKDDYYEFFATVFTNIEMENFKSTLLKNGFSPKDILITKNIMDSIINITAEDETNAREIIKTINGIRIPNITRLLNAIKFKTLAFYVKSQKNCVFRADQLCISEDTIRSAFKIDDPDEIQKILDKALAKVMISPEFNEQYKILAYLNKERN